jgi:transposase
VRSDYHKGTTWAPVGKTPVVRSTGTRYRYNMFSVINGRGELRFILTQQGLRAGMFIEFLKRLLRGARSPIFLIVDGHPSPPGGYGGPVCTFQRGRMRLFFLPPYSPELNPSEQIWNEVKKNKVGRQGILDGEGFRRILLGALRALQKMPALVCSYFRLPDTLYAHV